MDQEKHYTAADIENYFAGKLLPAQRYAIEKAALEDPFLAEAMEGYEAMQGNDWSATLAGLQQEIAARSQGAKLVTMHPRRNKGWKIAVAAVLLGITITAAYLLFTNKNESPKGLPQLAQNKPVTKQSVPDTIRVNNAIPAPAETLQPADDKVKIVAPSSNTFTAQRQAKKITTSTKDLPTAASNAPKSTEVTGNLSNANPGVQTQGYSGIAKNTVPATAPVTTADKSSAKYEGVAVNIAPFPVARNFNAVVLAPDNTPLPFANIAIRSENFGTYADVKGNVRLQYPDSLLTVEVSSAGYKPRNFVLRSNILQNKLVLAQEPIPLNETTVIRSRSNGKLVSRRVSLLKDTAVSVEPADGWENYNRYIANNITIPDEIIQKNLHGEMEISFDVQSNGAISNVKVDKSLCDDCDEAAKRILEQGPQWKVKKGKAASGRIKLRF